MTLQSCVYSRLYGKNFVLNSPSLFTNVYIVKYDNVCTCSLYFELKGTDKATYKNAYME